MVAEPAGAPRRAATSGSSGQRPAPASSRARLLAWAAAAAVVGLAVPVAVWSPLGPWSVLLLPPLTAALAWDARRVRHQAQQERACLEVRAAAATVHDELTGSCNRAGLQLFAAHLLHSVRRRGDAMHAFVVDVNEMGRVNALLSTQAGDEVLVAVAEAVRASVRGTDVVARGGGDEFVVVGPGSGVHPGELERRVRAFLVESPPAPLQVWSCRVTVGHATLEPWDGGDLDDLVTRAYQDLQLRSALRAPSAPEPPLIVPGGLGA